MTPVVVTATNTETSPGVNATLITNVSCPSSAPHAIGGGGDITNASSSQNVFLDSSIPTGGTSTTPPTGWHAQAEQSAAPLTGNGQWSLTTYVVCSP